MDIITEIKNMIKIKKKPKFKFVFFILNNLFPATSEKMVVTAIRIKKAIMGRIENIFSSLTFVLDL
jgi:hypothetical protein